MADRPKHWTITTKLITALEGGVVPWSRPWSSNRNQGAPMSFQRHWRFTGINQLMLNIQADALGFRSKWWATERQWYHLNAKVKKKPDGILVASWGQAVRPFGNYYYNIDQVVGPQSLNPYRYWFQHEPLEPRYEDLVSLFLTCGVEFRFGGDKAVYRQPPLDYIECPWIERFERKSEFLTTVLHEVGHWAMRHMGLGFGHATNELIVQLMACYVGAEMNVPVEEDIENHAAYLDMWLEEMKRDNAYILKVSKDAMRVARWLIRRWQPKRRVG